MRSELQYHIFPKSIMLKKVAQYTRKPSFELFMEIVNTVHCHAHDQELTSDGQYDRLVASFLEQNLPINRILFLTYGDPQESIPYFYRVLQYVGPDKADLCFVKKKGDIDLESYGLGSFNVIEDISLIRYYGCIFVDDFWLKDLYRDFGYIIYKFTQRIICYTHSIDFSGYDLSICSCFITSHSKAIDPSQNIFMDGLSDRTRKMIRQISPLQKSEIAVTGPFHIGEYLERRKTKQEYRRELEEYLEMKLPDEKPVLAVFDNIATLPGQLLVAINKLAMDFTVIFKERNTLDRVRHVALSPEVILYRGGRSPNTLRFGADFILAGYEAATFYTSVMLGLDVIPYYTRYIRHFWVTGGKTLPYSCLIPQMITPMNATSKNILLDIFHRAGHLFDILKTEEIKKAVLGNEYLEWYHTNLPRIQRETFGDYLLEGAPEKTAEYILRFAKDGTLGDDCAAVHFKFNPRLPDIGNVHFEQNRGEDGNTGGLS